jgi:hypothetical protein
LSVSKLGSVAGIASTQCGSSHSRLVAYLLGEAYTAMMSPMDASSHASHCVGVSVQCATAATDLYCSSRAPCRCTSISTAL